MKKECEFIRSIKDIPECSVCSRPLTPKEVAGQFVYHGFADNGDELMVCQECFFLAIQKIAEEKKGGEE